MDEILEMARKKNIKIIEAASQSLGSKLKENILELFPILVALVCMLAR